MKTEQHQARRATTFDRGPPDRIPIHTVEQLGPKRRLLPNGSLLCEDVPLARTGWLLYGPGEVPLSPDPATGRILVERSEKELFRAETIGSFMACPVVEDHPDAFEGVTPENWRELAGGFSTTNVRRGTGPDSDVLLGDILVTRKDMIEAVMSGKREVSIGYDADYLQTASGQGVQLNIIGNHIALVERGRCGPRCAIGDHATIDPNQAKEEPAMATSTTATPTPGAPRRIIDIDKLEAFMAQDDKQPTTGVHVHVHTGDKAAPDAPAGKTTDADPVEARLTALEGSIGTIAKAVEGFGKTLDAIASGKKVEDEDPDADDLDKKKTKTGDALTGDSKALETSWTALRAKCEVLVPGMKLPTFDSAQPRKLTVDRMCQQRRRVLDAFSVTPDGAAILASVTGDEAPDIAGMACDSLAIVFNGAHAAKAATNNRRATGDSSGFPAPASGNGGQGDGKPQVSPITAMEDANRNFWKR